MHQQTVAEDVTYFYYFWEERLNSSKFKHMFPLLDSQPNLYLHKLYIYIVYLQDI